MKERCPSGGRYVVTFIQLIAVCFRRWYVHRTPYSPPAIPYRTDCVCSCAVRFTCCRSSVATKVGPGLLCGIFCCSAFYFVYHSPPSFRFSCLVLPPSLPSPPPTTPTLPPSVAATTLPHRTTSPLDHGLSSGSSFSLYILCVVNYYEILPCYFLV